MEEEIIVTEQTRTDRIEAFVRRYRFPIIAVGVASLVIIAYVIRFAPNAHWRWSADPEDWAQFGEYVGGVLGFFAFVGVLITVDLQGRQLSQLTNQATIDELLRICRDLASSIDDALDGALIIDASSTAAADYKPGPTTMRGVLDKAAHIDELSGPAPIMPGMLQITFAPRIKRNMDIANPELDLLAECVTAAMARGGSGVMMKYYRARYGEVVRRMNVLGFKPKSTEFWLTPNQ